MIYLGLLIVGMGFFFWAQGEDGGRTVFFVGIGFTWASAMT